MTWAVSPRSRPLPLAGPCRPDPSELVTVVPASVGQPAAEKTRLVWVQLTPARDPGRARQRPGGASKLCRASRGRSSTVESTRSAAHPPRPSLSPLHPSSPQLLSATRRSRRKGLPPRAAHGSELGSPNASRRTRLLGVLCPRGRAMKQPHDVQRTDSLSSPSPHPLEGM